MIWLFIFLIFLQVGWNLLFNPLIVGVTELFELRGVWLIVFFLIIWIFSAVQNESQS